MKILSAICFFSGLYLFTNSRRSLLKSLIFAFLSTTSCLLFLVYGVANYFTGNGIDKAAFYHLRYGLKGAGFQQYGMIIMTGIITLLIFIFVLWRILREGQGNRKISANISLGLLLISVMVNPTSLDFYRLQQKTVPSGDDFYAFYHHPHINKIPSKKQKKLGPYLCGKSGKELF